MYTKNTKMLEFSKANIPNFVDKKWQTLPTSS